MSKLTLSVNDRIISQAKRYAKQQGVSVSKMVEAYLSAVAEPQPAPDTPVLGLVRGSLKRDGLQAYRKHLAAKYR
jgi:Family of unknown function (DUF6364)